MRKRKKEEEAERGAAACRPRVKVMLFQLTPVVRHKEQDQTEHVQ